MVGGGMEDDGAESVDRDGGVPEVVCDGGRPVAEG